MEPLRAYMHAPMHTYAIHALAGFMRWLAAFKLTACLKLQQSVLSDGSNIVLLDCWTW